MAWRALLKLGSLGKLVHDDLGAVAPTVALSLFGLIGACGIAFDYARLAGMDTELQNAADHAALAGVSQLDGKANARSRATTAAQSLVVNDTRFANDGSGRAVTVPTIAFYQDEAGTVAATSDADAGFIRVTVASRVANYALTPVVGAFNSGNVNAAALAGLKVSVCNSPPLYMAFEPGAEDLTRLNPGVGVWLLGEESSSHFGYLENGASGGSALKEAMAWDNQAGNCLNSGAVSVKTGVVASVETGFNTRFQNGQCPNGGTCSQAAVTTEYDVDSCHSQSDPNVATTPCTKIGSGVWPGQPAGKSRYQVYKEAVGSGYTQGGDRRRLTIAMIPYGSFGSGSSGAAVIPSKWMDVFIARKMAGNGNSLRLYVEIIGISETSTTGRRDVPYLIE